LDLYVEALQGGADAANDLACPQLLAEEHERTIFEAAHGAEKIIRECFVVSIHAPAGQLAFESGVPGCELRTRAGAESFALKAVQERFQRGKGWSGDYDGAMGGFAEGDLMPLAEITQAIEVAEEVEPPGSVAGHSGENAAPNAGRIRTANRLAVFVRLGQFEADGADIGAEVKGFDFEEVHLVLRGIG
jgi:hypothetical protein